MSAINLPMITEAALAATIEVIVESALRELGKVASAKESPRVRVDVSGVRRAILTHLDEVERWSTEIAFRGLHTPRQLSSHFVTLDCELGVLESPREKRVGHRMGVTQLAFSRGNAVILGRPGAGKTTTLQRLAQLGLEQRNAGKPGLPVLLRFRALTETDSVVDELLASTGVRIEFKGEFSENEKARFKRDALLATLDKLNALTLLDGLDEAPSASRGRLEKELDHLLAARTECRFVMSCRTADYQRHQSGASVYVIQPLTRPQVEEFAQRWLGVEATSFVDKVYKSPFAGVEVLPLTVGHLCMIYAKTGDIPEKPQSVYRRIVRLLLEEWDAQRGITRASRYAGFDIDRKEGFLHAIAHALTLDGHRSSFRHVDLQRAYDAVHLNFDLPKTHAGGVARELESHSGLVLALDDDEFEFAHKSLQEYLCAEYLVRLPKISATKVSLLPNELAIAACLSSDSSAYLEAVLACRPDQDFLVVFAARLVAEKPDFRPTARLGWVLLTLLHRLQARHVRPNAVADSEQVRAILAIPGARRAVAEALASSESDLRGSDWIAVWPPSGSRTVPDFVQSYLSDQLVDGFNIHQAVMAVIKGTVAASHVLP